MQRGFQRKTTLPSFGVLGAYNTNLSRRRSPLSLAHPAAGGEPLLPLLTSGARPASHQHRLDRQFVKMERASRADVRRAGGWIAAERYVAGCQNKEVTRITGVIFHARRWDF